MHLSLAEDDALIVASVTALCAKSVTPVATAWDEARAIDPAVWTQVAELGLFGMAVPETHEGVGLSWRARAAVLRALGAGDPALAWVIGMHDALACGLVVGAASPASQAALLPGWARGETIASACVARPGIVVESSGGGLVLRGQTEVTVGAGLAGALLLLLPAGSGAQLVLLRPEDSGVGLRRADDWLGARAAAAASVTLRDVRVRPDAVLVREGQGRDLAAEARAATRLAVAAISCGVGRAATEAAIAYAKAREQFGQPIANFQAIQWKLADATCSLDAADLLVGRAAWAADRDGSVTPPFAAQACLRATAAAAQACTEALQIHGGYGYTTEFPVERLLRGAKALAAGARHGSAQTVADAIARRYSTGAMAEANTSEAVSSP